MKKLLVAGLATFSLLSLNACKTENGLLDFTGNFFYNQELVFSTENTIADMKTFTSAEFEANAVTTLGTLGAADDAHNGNASCHAYTKHPIVLVHGLYGFDQVVGVDYWYRVIEAIELGGGEAYTIPVPKLNSTEVRGEHLLSELKKLKATLEAANDKKDCAGNPVDRDAANPVKFHLMGHSHGGPTTRYIIEAGPELLASVTTIGGLNAYGIAETKNMKLFMDLLTSFYAGPLLQGMMNGLAELIEHVGGNKQNHVSYSVASFQSLSAEGITQFNEEHNIGLPSYFEDHKLGNANYAEGNDSCLVDANDPSLGIKASSHGVPLAVYTVDANGQADTLTEKAASDYNPANPNQILFFSWSGTGVKTNVLDPTDVLVTYTSKAMCDKDENDVELMGCEPSDGMVQQCASHFGTVLRSDYDMNHLDEINWVMGLRRMSEVNPLVIFRQTANRLGQLGL